MPLFHQLKDPESKVSKFYQLHEIFEVINQENPQVLSLQSNQQGQNALPDKYLYFLLSSRHRFESEKDEFFAFKSNLQLLLHQLGFSDQVLSKSSQLADMTIG